jgi:glycosyltransferase involved in cell wall biosynthesis
MLLAGTDSLVTATTGILPSRRPRALPSFVGVVIPASDEADRIVASLEAVFVAGSHPLFESVVVTVVVVDDSSSDLTGELALEALGSRGGVTRVDARSAGAARRAGFVELCRLSDGLDDHAVWFATTDADTIVSSDWLIGQLRWRRAGADAVAGLVTAVSWEQQPAIVRLRYRQHMARFGSGFGHPHVYGANLGLSKAAYLHAGGIAEIESGEDHALWDSIGQSEYVRAQVPDVMVATSARREGRAPDGFSALLRSLGERS